MRPTKVAIFLLAIVVIFAACKKPEQTIGLEIQPEDDFLNVYQTDTTSLLAKTIVEDSLRTDELSISLLGNYLDPSMGVTYAEIFSQIRLSSNNVEFGDPANLVVDSLILSLVYTNSVDTYGSLSPQSFVVNEIVEEFEFDSSYYSNQSVGFDNTNLIEIGKETQAIDLTSYVQLEIDSVVPQLRLPLKKELGERFFEMSNDGLLEDNTSFLEEFKGLHLLSTSIDGAVIPLDLLNGDSKLTLYYHELGEDADTLNFTFFINSNCARFNRYTHSFSNELSGLSANNPIDGDENCYVQGGASVKTKVEFPNLMDFNEIEGRTINKAELIIANKALDARFPVLDNLYVLMTDEDGNEDDLPDALTFNHEIGGTFNSSDEMYHFNITRYIQAVLNGELPNDGITIIANHAGVLVNRSILVGPNSFQDPEKNMSLVLTFSN